MFVVQCACMHMHTHTHTVPYLTHMLDINIYLSVGDKGGRGALGIPGQRWYSSNIWAAIKKKKRISNYRKPGENTFQELKIILILKIYVSGMWEVIATPFLSFTDYLFSF